MKNLFLVALSTTILFAVTPKEKEVTLAGVVDISVKHTNQMEKRIAKLNVNLEKKALQRLEKEKIREAKLQKLDYDLQIKADKRAKPSK